MKKLRFLLFILMCGYFQGYSQKEILYSSLEEYGTNMKFEQVWTDEEFIIVLAKGNNGSRNTYLLVHPEKGILSSHTFDKSNLLKPYKFLTATPDEITTFYTFKNINYSITFSKLTSKVETQVIKADLRKIDKEAIFSFLKDGRYIFASITKDKSKIGFRELTKTGEDQVVSLFDMPDLLMKYLNPSDFSRKETLSNPFIFQNSIRLIGKDIVDRKSTLDVFDFRLDTQKLEINKLTLPKKYRSFAASFGHDNLYVLESDGITALEINLEIYSYPDFKILNRFSYNLSSVSIPIKSSSLINVNFKRGMYHSGRNKKFTDMDNGVTSVNKTLNEICGDNNFLITENSSDGSVFITVGNTSEVFITNTTIINTAYFFGCLDSNLQPCKRPAKQKSSSENFSDYMTSISDEKPEYEVFGSKRHFAIFNLKASKEIAIMEF